MKLASYLGDPSIGIPVYNNRILLVTRTGVTFPEQFDRIQA
jgi:hypothetical protein